MIWLNFIQVFRNLDTTPLISHGTWGNGRPFPRKLVKLFKAKKCGNEIKVVVGLHAVDISEIQPVNEVCFEAPSAPHPDFTSTVNCNRRSGIFVEISIFISFFDVNVIPGWFWPEVPQIFPMASIMKRNFKSKGGDDLKKW